MPGRSAFVAFTFRLGFAGVKCRAMNLRPRTTRNTPRLRSLCRPLLVGAALGAVAAAQDSPGAADTRAALAQQRTNLVGAIGRADAAGVAGLFTADAKLIVSEFKAVAGRAAIQQAWQFTLGSGAVARLVLEPKDLEGLDGGLPVETGTMVIFDREGKERAHNNYLLVWKREDGAWKIHRDMASPRFAPAPTADRVGFPQDYRKSLTMLAAPTVNPKLGLVQTAYGNESAAASTAAGKLPFAYGSVLVMEFAQVVKDNAGNPLLDSAGNAQRGPVLRVDVMRREPGFGEAYGANRAGEWEFVSYRVDGSHATPPVASGSCAACHLNRAGPGKDFVFPLANTRGPTMTMPAAP